MATTWRGSRYNVFMETPGDVVFVANSLSRAVVSVPREVAAALRCRPLSSRFVSEPALGDLIRGGFAVPTDLDESGLYERWFRRIQSDLTEVRCTLALTSRCNLACRYCFERGIFGRTERTMSLDGARAVARWLSVLCAEAAPRALTVMYYGGEPTIEPMALRQTTELLRRLSAPERRVAFGLYTNAVDLSPEVQALCAAPDFTHAQVSVDGPPAVHDRRRRTTDGSPTFASVWNNIALLTEDCGLSVKLVVNFDSSNAAQVPALLDMLVVSSFADRVTLAFNPVFRTPHIEDYCAAHCPPVGESYSLWQDLYREALDRSLNVQPMRLFQKGPCSLHRIGHFVVSPEGDIYECIGLLGDRRYRSDNVRESECESAISSRAAWIREHTALRRECRSCTYLPLCNGGCRFQALCESGSLKARACQRSLIEDCELPLVQLVAERSC